MKEEDEKMIIFDTRPCAISEKFTLTGVENAIYKACRHPVTKTEIYNVLHSDTRINSDELVVECSLEQLIHKRLLLQLNGRYLALANLEPRKKIANQGSYLGKCNKNTKVREKNE